jgi:ABC-type Zn uptake system ZnuABC Zn-binding protein ZnuA/ABC-type Mn2+/Zn2+ transport system permease subunit
LFEPFQLPYVQRGLIEVLILALGAGVLGTWIVLRGLAFFSHAVGTAAFPGLVLADGLGFSASLGAFGIAALFTVALWALARRRGPAYDSLTALVLVGCLAAGVILASDVFHSGSNVEQLLFGSLLLVDGADIRLAIGATAVALIGSLLLGSRWLAAGFDELGEPATRGRGGWLELMLLGLIALATTAALTVIGALLVAALFVAPAATVRLFANRMRSWQIWSVLLAAAEGTIGLWLSVKTNAPPGATIATLSGAVFALAAIARAIASRTRTVAVAGALGAVLLVAGCGGSDSGSDSGKVSVVATTPVIGDWVREVAGENADVTQILAPNTDPHDYEPRPDDVTKVADAEVVFANGDDLDHWIDQVVSDSGSDAEVVDLGADVPVKLPGESEGEEHEGEEHEGEEHVGEEAGFDPHWWHDPGNAEEAVREIATQMSAVAPGDRGTFEANAAGYEAKLKALDAGIRRCIDSVPAGDRKLVTDHDAFNYFTNRYGIEVVGAVIPSQTTQAQPNAKDLSDLADVIRTEGVKAIFPESSLSPDLAETIASQTGAQVGEELYGDTLGPEDSSGDTYLKMEAANANAMVEGFTGGQRGCEPPVG